MNSLPSLYGQKPLEENDFIRFFLPFSKILKTRIPTASRIFFVSDNSDSVPEKCSQATRKAVREIMRCASRQPDTVTVLKNGFLLPFTISGSTVVAVILGVDPFIAAKADPEWLVEMRNDALAEFVRLKRERIDWDTGLLNAANLQDVLEILHEANSIWLMLVEIYPKARSSNEAISSVRRASLSLLNFSENRFLVHYLGHGLFALVAQQEELFSRAGALLLSWLRRDGFPRAHIGCSRKRESPEGEPKTQVLFDEAWQALQVAGKRGPFSFCDFSLLAHPEKHPLRRPSRSITAKLAGKWKSSDRFSVVLFHVDKGLHSRLFQSKAVDEDVTAVGDGDDLYVFLDGMDSAAARKWAQPKVDAVLQWISRKQTFVVGIATYPFVDFTKTETLHNCRKALLAAAFYGHGGVAVFDAVSLNISGDHFFGEGDLANSVREYKRGLVCDGNDINLLNSLGVTYAMMERHRQAHQCFNMVLAIDPDNFMALYNLGLGEKNLGLHESAIARFERAVSMYPRNSEDTDNKNDLQFELGKLYCITGAYAKAAEILRPWHTRAAGTKKAGYACRFLGKSYHGLERYSEAMVWLQRALQFDGFDAEILGLLGEVYLEQGEGDEIALSLCEKSVELDPGDLGLRLGLAKVQMACGKLAAAKVNLRPCLRSKMLKEEARKQRALIREMELGDRHPKAQAARLAGEEKGMLPVAKEGRYSIEAEGNG